MSRLAIVYHRPFTLAPDGSLWEAEGAFSTYVESLAPNFDEVSLVVPARRGAGQGHRLRAANVRLCPLPPFDGLMPFYRRLPRALLTAWRDSRTWDLVSLRVPTLFAPWAFLIARLRGVPVFLLVVGDLRESARAARPTVKRRLYRLYVELEEAALDRMAAAALTFCNGAALTAKHARPGRRVYEARTSTLSADAFFERDDTCRDAAVTLLCVSRVDPRKGIRYLPAALAALADEGVDARLRVIGPIVGSIGVEERAETLRRAAALGMGERITFEGGAPIERVFRAYREADVFVLPSLPGEGVPRVLLEAMAASLPIVTTRVAGIPGAIRDGETGLLVEPTSSDALADALLRLVRDGDLRRSLIRNGRAEAREHTAARQADLLLDAVAREYPGRVGIHGAAREFGERATSVRSAGACPPPVATSHGQERPDAATTPRTGTSDEARQGTSPRAADEATNANTSADCRSLRIAIPLASFNVSGGVQSYIHLANGLAARGHRVRFVVPDFAAAPPRPLAPAVQLRVLRTGPFPRPFRQSLYYLRLLTDSTQAADVCLANYWPTAYTALASRLLRDPGTALAYNVRAYEPLTHGRLAESSGLGRRLRAWLAAGSYRLPLRRLVTSSYLRRMIGDPSAPIMGHGIDSGTFSPPHGPRHADDGVTVGVVARLGDVKGYPDFLAALDHLPPAASFRLLVGGDPRAPLPTREPAERVATPDEAAMAAFYRRCDIFVFPSRSEGFGLPALEALASGCALLSTDCGGVREFARPAGNCLLVPPADPPALAAGLLRLLREPDLRHRLSAAGVRDAQAWSREAVTERFARELCRLAREG